jgi:hypothetical protein
VSRLRSEELRTGRQWLATSVLSRLFLCEGAYCWSSHLRPIVSVASTEVSKTLRSGSNPDGPASIGLNDFLM